MKQIKPTKQELQEAFNYIYDDLMLFCSKDMKERVDELIKITKQLNN